jgi:hypothetical protein
MDLDLFSVHSRLARRWGRWFTTFSLLIWTILLPITAPWLAVSLLARYRALDRSPEARMNRRVARMLAWYPPQWRARYGEEFAEILRQTIRDGHGGLRLTANVVRESGAARLAPYRRREIGAILCWSLCWIPLIAQGLVPLILSLTGSTSRGWFVALYTPVPFRWVVIALMLALGSWMLITAVRTPGLVAAAFGRRCTGSPDEGERAGQPG